MFRIGVFSLRLRGRIRRAPRSGSTHRMRRGRLYGPQGLRSAHSFVSVHASDFEPKPGAYAGAGIARKVLAARRGDTHGIRRAESSSSTKFRRRARGMDPRLYVRRATARNPNSGLVSRETSSPFAAGTSGGLFVPLVQGPRSILSWPNTLGGRRIQLQSLAREQ